MTEAELRAYVASLPNAPSLPAKFDAAFPVIKQRAIENLQAQINAGSENIALQKSESLQVFLKEAIRNTAQAILMATAFSALAALGGPKATNAITKLFTRFFPRALRSPKATNAITKKLFTRFFPRDRR